MTGKVKLTGIGELKRKFAQMTLQAQNKIARQGITEAAKLLRKEIRQRAPKDTGFLRRNIRYKIRRKQRGHFVGKVGVAGDAYYARFIEYGSSPHRIPSETVGRGRNKTKNNARVAFGGGVYTSIQHPGTAARPFLRPAFDQNVRLALDATKKKLWDGILAEAKK